MVNEMKYASMVVIGTIIGVLVCITMVSPVFAAEKKISPVKISLQNENVSTVTPGSIKDEGTTLFDGKKIIQSQAVLDKAYHVLELSESINPETIIEEGTTPHENVDWYQWTLRDFADYAKDPSHSITYTITICRANFVELSKGVLGYYPSTDLMMGSMNPHYWISETASNFPEGGLHKFPSSQERVIIEPDNNRLIYQVYSLNSLSPSSEEAIDIEGLPTQKNILLGKSSSNVFYIVLQPYPDPNA